MKKKNWAFGTNIVLVDEETPPQASPERVFVYVLMLNSKDLHSSQPFTVGYSNNLQRRFSNHAAVNWHMKTFGSKPKLWIAGSIHLNFAEKAVQDLTNIFTNNNVLLLGQKDSKPADRLEKQTIASLRKYTLKRKPLTSSIQEWDSKWGVKHKVDPNAIPPLLLTKPLPVSEVISKQFLLNVITGRKYKTSQAVLFSHKLVKAFNEENQTASYAIPVVHAFNKQARILQELKANLDAVSADWKLSDKALKPGSNIILKPTVALIKHAHKHSKQ